MLSLINDDDFIETFITKLCQNEVLLLKLRTAMFPDFGSTSSSSSSSSSSNSGTVSTFAPNDTPKVVEVVVPVLPVAKSTNSTVDIADSLVAVVHVVPRTVPSSSPHPIPDPRNSPTWTTTTTRINDTTTSSDQATTLRNSTGNDKDEISQDDHTIHDVDMILSLKDDFFKDDGPVDFHQFCDWINMKYNWLNHDCSNINTKTWKQLYMSHLTTVLLDIGEWPKRCRVDALTLRQLKLFLEETWDIYMSPSRFSVGRSTPTIDATIYFKYQLSIWLKILTDFDASFSKDVDDKWKQMYMGHHFRVSVFVLDAPNIDELTFRRMVEFLKRTREIFSLPSPNINTPV